MTWGDDEGDIEERKFEFKELSIIKVIEFVDKLL